jgi:hypothetical protein
MNEVFRATLHKDRLLAIDPAERSLFLALGHVANEINILHKQILWSARFGGDRDAVTKAQIGLCFTFVRLVAGKLNEGGELLKTGYLRAKLGTTYGPLLDAPTSEALTYLKRYFSGSNSIGMIRNNFAFHYSAASLDASLPGVEDDLELFVSSHYGNSMYYACEVVANRAMLDALGGELHQVALNAIVQEVLLVARRFMAFATGFMAAFLARHPDIWTDFAKPVDLPKLAPLLEVELPWFTDNSAVEAASGGSPNTSLQPTATGHSPGRRR